MSDPFPKPPGPESIAGSTEPPSKLRPALRGAGRLAMKGLRAVDTVTFLPISKFVERVETKVRVNSLGRGIDRAQGRMDELDGQIAALTQADPSSPRMTALLNEQQTLMSTITRDSQRRSAEAGNLRHHYESKVNGGPLKMRDEWGASVEKIDKGLTKLRETRERRAAKLEECRERLSAIVQSRAYTTPEDQENIAAIRAEFVTWQRKIAQADEQIKSTENIRQDFQSKISSWDRRNSNVRQKIDRWGAIEKNGRSGTNAQEFPGGPKIAEAKIVPFPAGGRRTGPERPTTVGSGEEGRNKLLQDLAALLNSGEAIDVAQTLRDLSAAPENKYLNESRPIASLVNTWNELARREGRAREVISTKRLKDLTNEYPDTMTLANFGIAISEKWNFEPNTLVAGILTMADALKEDEGTERAAA